ncbi:MAG: hypothetical protein KatS3mg002_0882 [Candidatus Woesearchaeota archaeon]|nr:MAG: hypothetical protein KatS3mg002_0882 [Candidatus Woesearchaeota archaeon]
MNYIYDKNNLIDVIDSFPEQIMEAYEYSLNIKISNFPESIFICGMGGSGIAGKILEQYTASAGLKIPVYCVNDYEIPSFCKSNSLFIICSYSGNTEESISCYKQAIKLSDNMQRIIVVASDGKLKEYAENNKNSLIVLPKGLQPRNAIAYLFFPILKVLEKNNLIERQERYVRELIEYLKKNNKKIAFRV